MLITFGKILKTKYKKVILVFFQGRGQELGECLKMELPGHFSYFSSLFFVIFLSFYKYYNDSYRFVKNSPLV